MYHYISKQLSKFTTNKKRFISIILSLFIPALYGVILLTSKMHPTDHMDHLPIAVVNNDTGVLANEENIHVGNELVERLKESKTLGWDFVDTATAMNGLQNNDYYMVIVIPEDFSQNITTLTDANPKKLQLQYIQNEGLNFTAATITDRAAETIRQQLEESIIQQFATNVVTQVGDGLEEAATGSEQLADGMSQLKDGTEQLHASVTNRTNDIARLADGTKQLKNGTSLLLSNLTINADNIHTLAEGSKKLHEGTIALKNGTNEILTGLQDAKAGSSALYAGLTKQLTPGSARLADGVVEFVNTIEPLISQVGPLLGFDPVETSQRLTELKNGAIQLKEGLAVGSEFEQGLKKLDHGLQQLVDGQNKVNDGAKQLESGAKQIADGNAQVKSGWNELTDGVKTLDSGAAQIANGNAQVYDGWLTLVEGATQLNDGATKLQEGSYKLADGLKSGVENIAPLKNGDKNIEMFASPVENAFETINSPQYYRDTTAPLIMSLGLFVGILILSLFMNVTRPAEVSVFRWFIRTYGKLSVLAVIQALLLLMYVLVIIRMQVTNPIWLTITLFVAALSFSAIVLFLAAIAGNVGRFIAIALVLAQLPTTGGDLPIIMLSDGLQRLSAILPFKYSIAGFRTSILLGNTDQIMYYIGALILFGIIALLLTLAVYFVSKHKNIQSISETG